MITQKGSPGSQARAAKTQRTTKGNPLHCHGQSQFFPVKAAPTLVHLLPPEGRRDYHLCLESSRRAARCGRRDVAEQTIGLAAAIVAEAAT